MMSGQTEHPYILRTVYRLNPDVVMGITQVDERTHNSTPIELLAACYSIKPDRMCMLSQVHGGTVHLIEGPTHGLEGDGMIARGTDLMLVVKVADCCAVLLHDPVTHAIGAVHSGWRGTHARIVATAIRAMTDRFGTDPVHLHAVICPCASGERYEVRQDVADLFPDHVRRVHEGVWLFDNRAAIVRQMAEEGMPPDRIMIDPSDTLVDRRYHSYRRDGADAGRSLAYVGHLSYA